MRPGLYPSRRGLASRIPRCAVNSSDLTSSLYFSAAVRVAADVSLTRLLPLDALHPPLAPHGSYSQRVLLSLQALGVIEPELALSRAGDWRMPRDWMPCGFDSVAWRIRWPSPDCRCPHDEVKELLKDVVPSEDNMRVLLTLWEDLALAEAVQYASWALAKSGYNPEWAAQATEELRKALKHFGVAQVMYLISLAVHSVATTCQRGSVEAIRLGQVFASSIAKSSRLAAMEHWSTRGISRPEELPLSTLAKIFAYEVTRLDNSYLTLRPSLDALREAMTRCQTIH